MRKTLSILILVFLVGLIAVNAEKVDIEDNIIDFILDNYKDAGLTQTSVILYCNPSILDCGEFEKVTADLSHGSVFVTNDYFTNLSTGSLAVCLLDFSTRSGIKPREVKDYINYCKNFETPPGGLFTIYQEREKNRYIEKGYIILPESSLNEDIVYVIIDKMYREHNCMAVELDSNNPRVQAKYKAEAGVDSDFPGELLLKVQDFVYHRLNDGIFQRQLNLKKEDDKLYEEKVSFANLSTPEATARLAEIKKRRAEIEESAQKLRDLKEKADTECNYDILGDDVKPFEGEVIDGFTIRKGWPPEPKYNYPPKFAEFNKEIDKGNVPEITVVIGRLGDIYVFVEDEAKQKSTSTSIPAEEKPVIESKEPVVAEGQPVTKEKLIEEQKPAAEEQPITGFKKLTNSLKELFFGKSVEEETSQEKQSPEQPAEQLKEEEKFLNKILCKLLHPFSKKRYGSCLAG